MFLLFRPRTILILFLWLLNATCISASGLLIQKEKIPFTKGPETKGYTLIQELDSLWLDGNLDQIQIPFCDTSGSSYSLRTAFLYKKGSGPLFLYFQGIAGKTEIYINGALLKIWNSPFIPIIVPLPEGNLLQGVNILRVNIIKSTSGFKFAHAPLVFTGIHKPVFLLSKSGVIDSSYTVTHSQNQITGKTLAIVAPWFPGIGYNLPVSRAKKCIKELKDRGIYSVFFPYFPGNHIVSLFQDSLINIMESTDSFKILWLYNEYPGAKNSWQNSFTYDLYFNQMNKVTYVDNKEYIVIKSKKDKNIRVIFLLVIPLLLLSIVKQLDSFLFGSLWKWVSMRNMQLVSLITQKTIRSWDLLLLNFTHMVLFSIILSALLDYIRGFDLYQLLHPTWGHGWLIQIVEFLPEDSVMAFLVILLICLATNFFKILIIGIIQLIFGSGKLVIYYLNANIIASFPLNIIITFLSLFLILPGIQSWFIYVVISGMLIYFFRRWYLNYSLFSEGLRINTAWYFLYICTSEILPWLLLV